MKIKTLVLGSLLAFGLPLAAEAQMTTETSESYENYQVSCNSETYDPANPECDSFNVNYEAESESTGYDEYSQRRTRRSRRSRTPDYKYYAGGNLGLFFPGGDADTGFGFSILGGRQFNKYFSADLEFLFYGGGTEIDELGYNNLGVLVNAKGQYPFNQNKTNSVYIYGAGGIGYGRVADTGDVADARDDIGIEVSDGGFAFQFKAGLGYPLKDNVDLFGQFRYLNISVDDSFDNDAFSLDLGAKFKF